MARPGSELVGRVLGGRYRLVALVGVGASAQVYLADDVSLRRRVAIKLLHEALADDASFLRRFRIEAQSAAQLHHPNILVIHDWNDGANALGDPPYIVTEYLEGGSLRSLLDQPYQMSPSQALVGGLQAARALEHAHARGFVHRDIKPANLLFDGEGRIRIGDFGLARALAEAAWTEPSGALLGTARYASPEQAKGASVDGKADVYALAMVLHEAALGVPAFAADTTIATLMQRLSGDYEPPAELDALAAPLLGAGRIDPAQRSSAAVLVTELEAAARLLPRPQPLPAPTRLAPSVAPDEVERTHMGPAGVASARSPLLPPTAPHHEQDGPIGAVSTRDVVSTAHGGVVHGGAVHGDGPVLDLAAEPEVPAEATDGDGDPRVRRWPKRLLALVVVLGVLSAGGALAAQWWRNGHPPRRDIPSVVGRTEAVARTALHAVDLVVVVQRRFDETVAAPNVLTQDPPANARVDKGSAVRLTISRGPAPREVPELSGLTVDEATQSLVQRGLVAGQVEERRDPAIEKGLIIEWSPRGSVARGRAVDLVVSAGKPLVAVPNVTGLTPSAALDVLQGLGFSVKEVRVFHPKVASGSVVSTNYKTGTALEPGSSVTLRVSKGPELVAVPDVRGATPAAAEATLKAAGFSVAGVDGSPSGTVTLTRPAPGAKVRPGTAVTLLT